MAALGTVSYSSFSDAHQKASSPMSNTSRPPEPDANHVLTAQDAEICGFDLAALKRDAAWVLDIRPVPAELVRDYPHAVYIEPERTFFPPLSERLDAVMRNRLIEFAKGMQ